MKVFVFAFLATLIAACGKSGSKSNSDKYYDSLEVDGSYTVPATFDKSFLNLKMEKTKTVTDGRITCTFGTNQGRIAYKITAAMLKLGSGAGAQYFFSHNSRNSLVGSWTGDVLTDDEKVIRVTLKFSESEMKVSFVCPG